MAKAKGDQKWKLQGTWKSLLKKTADMMWLPCSLPVEMHGWVLSWNTKRRSLVGPHGCVFLCSLGDMKDRLQACDQRQKRDRSRPAVPEGQIYAAFKAHQILSGWNLSEWTHRACARLVKELATDPDWGPSQGCPQGEGLFLWMKVSFQAVSSLVGGVESKGTMHTSIHEALDLSPRTGGKIFQVMIYVGSAFSQRNFC